MPRRNWKGMFQGGDDMSPLAITQLESLEDDLQALSAGGGASQTLLSTTTLASPGTFDVSGIAQTANDLILLLIVRGAASATVDSLLMRFNNDTGSNYGTVSMQNTATTPQGAQNNSATSMQFASIPAATAAAGVFGVLEIVVPGYASTVWNKTTLGRFSLGLDITSSSMTVSDEVTMWKSTAAVNRVQVFGSATANLATGSQLRIYGRT